VLMPLLRAGETKANGRSHQTQWTSKSRGFGWLSASHTKLLAFFSPPLPPVCYHYQLPLLQPIPKPKKYHSFYLCFSWIGTRACLNPCCSTEVSGQPRLSDSWYSLGSSRASQILTGCPGPAPRKVKSKKFKLSS